MDPTPVLDVSTSTINCFSGSGCTSESSLESSLPEVNPPFKRLKDLLGPLIPYKTDLGRGETGERCGDEAIVPN